MNNLVVILIVLFSPFFIVSCEKKSVDFNGDGCSQVPYEIDDYIQEYKDIFEGEDGNKKIEYLRLNKANNDIDKIKEKYLKCSVYYYSTNKKSDFDFNSGVNDFLQFGSVVMSSLDSYRLYEELKRQGEYKKFIDKWREDESYIFRKSRKEVGSGL